MKVFAVNGISLSGKDTFCEKVNSNSGVLDVTRVISTIDPIKHIYEAFFGWDGTKTDIHRKNLNTLKCIWIETSNGPHNWLHGQIEYLNNYGVDYLFVMVREFDEMIDAINLGRELVGHGETIRLERHGLPIPPVEQEFIDSHPVDYVYNWTIVNPTTDNYLFPKLDAAAKQFIYLNKTLGLEQFKMDYDRHLVWNPEDEKFHKSEFNG